MSEITRNLAIVIGIDQYAHAPKLSSACNDAKKLADILEDKLEDKQTYYQYDVLRLLDDDATYECLNDVINHLNQGRLQIKDELINLDKNHRLLFYFAGHGIANDAPESEERPEGFLVPQDADLNAGNSKLLPMRLLHEALVNTPCRHLLIILDCCFAGSFRWAGLHRNTIHFEPTKVYRERYKRFLKKRAQQVITSAAYNQKALDSIYGERGNSKGHSPFAELLFEVLTTKADRNLNGSNDKYLAAIAEDGVVTATELYTYLCEKLYERLGQAAERQTPGFCQLREHKEGEYIFPLPGFKESSLATAEKLSEKLNPYKGLNSFDTRDSELFFGRKTLTEKLSKAVDAQPLTVVLGASGSGKSSLVKAGLIPHLTTPLEKLTEQKERWHVLTPIRPGESPFTPLNDALIQSHLPLVSLPDQSQYTLTDSVSKWRENNPGSKLLLVIDQFEELMTLCRDDKQRNQFLDALEKALEAHPQQLRVVVTLRSDFEPQFWDHQTLRKRWKKARFIVPAMTQKELRQAIEEPAAARVIFFDPPNLVETLIDEVANMPGALPLLSFALSELYLISLRSGRGDRTISQEDYKKLGCEDNKTLGEEEDYETLGGVTRSITRRAEELHQKLCAEDSACQEMIRNVMLRMVSTNGGELARRRVPVSELVYTDSKNEQAQKIIQCFVEARLLVREKDAADQDYVEPAHDALVKRWSLLQKWISKEKERLVLQQPLAEDAREWEKYKKPEVPDPEAPNFKEILDLFWTEDSRVDQLERIINKPQSSWLNKIETEFIRACAKWRDRQEQEDLNTNLEISITSSQRLFEAGKKFDALTTLIKTGKNLKPELEKYESSRLYFLISFRDMFGELEACRRIAVHENKVTSISFNSHKNIIASSDREVIKLCNTDGTLKQILERIRGNEVEDLHFSHDGKLLAAADEDGNIDLWQIENNTENQLKQEHFLFHQTLSRFNPARSINFRANDKTLASCDGSTVVLWAPGNSSDAPFILGDADSISEDGNANCVAFSPDGEMIAVGYEKGVIKLWKPDGNEIATLKAAGSANSINFSHDGETLVVGCADAIQLWSIKEEFTKPRLHYAFTDIRYVTFSPDNRLIASIDIRNRITLWVINDKDRLNTELEKCITLKHEESYERPIEKVCFLKNLDQLPSIAYNYGKTIQLWNCIDNFTGYCQDDGKFYGHTEKIISIALSGNGKTIVTTSLDRTIKVWSSSGTLLKTLYSSEQEDNPWNRAKISQDGEIIVAALGIGKVIVWRRKKNSEYEEIHEIEASIADFDLSSSGNVYLIVEDKAFMQIFGLRENRVQLLLEASNQVKASFDSSGEVITSINTEGIVNTWITKNFTFDQIDSNFGENVQFANFFHNESSTVNSNCFITVSESSELIIWNVDKELKKTKLEKQFKRDSSATIVDLKLVKETILILSLIVDESGSEEYHVELYSLNGTSAQTVRLTPGSLSAISLNIDCKLIAVADSEAEHYENRMRLWNLDLKNLEKVSAILPCGVRSKLEIIRG